MGHALLGPDAASPHLASTHMHTITRTPCLRGLMRATLHLVNREFEALADDFVTLGMLPKAEVLLMGVVGEMGVRGTGRCRVHAEHAAHGKPCRGRWRGLWLASSFALSSLLASQAMEHC